MIGGALDIDGSGTIDAGDTGVTVYGYDVIGGRLDINRVVDPADQR